MNNSIINNRYKILSEIGSGGMAIVYKAHDLKLDRLVAIKILRKNLMNDTDFLKRFEKEAKSAARLSHVNIISIYDIELKDDLNYIVMEYVDGISLREFIEDQKKISWEESLNILIQTSKALENAHYHNIIHRDIKPDNIMIKEDGIVKISDFGIAKILSSETELTQTGTVLGSVYYLSPEQAKGIKADWRTDIYSLGITFYEMITGNPPFSGTNMAEIAYMHISTNPVPPISIETKIPPLINDIILKCLAKDKNERYPNISKLLIDLNKALKSSNLFSSTKFLHNKIYTISKENTMQQKINSNSSNLQNDQEDNLAKQYNSNMANYIKQCPPPYSPEEPVLFTKKMLFSFILISILVIISLIILKFMPNKNPPPNYNSFQKNDNPTVSIVSTTTKTPNETNYIKKKPVLTENPQNLSLFFNKKLANYYDSLIKAINENDFSLMEKTLVKNSKLYYMQKKLIINLNNQAIKEKLISFKIYEIENISRNKYKVFVEESIAVNKPPSASFNTYKYKYIYFAEKENDELLFSDIQKWIN